MDQIISYTIMISVILLMLSVGLRTAFSQVVQVVKNVPLLSRGLVANFIIVPALMFLCVRWLPVDADVKIAAMLMAAAPIAPMAPLPFVGIARGDVTFSAGLMVVAAILSVLFTPLILTFGLPSGEGAVQVDPMQIVQTLLVVQLIPIGLGMTIQRLSPRWNQRLVAFVPMVGQLGLLVGIVLLLVSQAKQIAAIGLPGFVINLALVVLCLAVGHVALLKDSGERRRSLAVSTAIRNIPLAFLIANASFAGTAVAPATLVFATFSMVLSVVYGKLEVRFVRP